MRNILEILDFIRNNENSAFFYTPNIYENAKSHLLKKPEIILEADDKTSAEKILAEADVYSKKENLVGAAIIPYETGYLFQSKIIESKFAESECEPKFSFMFYDKRNVEVIDSNEIDFNEAKKTLMDKGIAAEYLLNVGKDEYIGNIEKIKNHIASGDCYQINYTTKLKIKITENELAGIFLKGIFNQSSRYAAFINAGKNFIISFSPELFFETDYKTVKSKPMKGTVKRGCSNADDKRVAEELLNDEKNLSENVMIVDLLRNDIGKISEINSVEVPKLFETEKYETLFQLTSTVSGRLKEKPLSVIIKNLFPCGSITGAPKLRAMEIINELEKERRGIYTGSIGLITNEKATFNIAIRTLVVEKESGRAEFGVGSGIVWESVPEREYEETLLKGNFISKPVNYFELLESILFENGKYFLIDEHLKRLKEAADYFLFKYDEEKIIGKLKEESRKFQEVKKYKIRLTLEKWGGIFVNSEEISNNKGAVKAILQKRETHADERFHRHKTTNRPWDKDFARARENGFHEVIFYDDNNYLLEGAVTNLFIGKNGKYFTPPLELPILNGCYRKRMIEELAATEEKITIEDLKNADDVFLCNSVRKKISVAKIFDEREKTVFNK